MRAFIPIFFCAVLLSGCSNFFADAPVTARPPLAATLTPLPVDTLAAPTPTATATPAPFPAATGGPDGGALTPVQREQLYQSSLKYLAPSDDAAVHVALSLKFVSGADVSNMCGPLAIAILRDAGLLPAGVDLHDFWLLNPRQKKDRDVLARVFPAPEYADYPIDQPTNTFDFARFPLKAGDFLYIYAGERGSFEHMLTVTRVDEAGRAYTVTNLHTDSYHFAIGEVVLYDPARPGVGQFYEWTRKENYRLGLTGFGGFEIWRRIAPLPPVAH